MAEDPNFQVKIDEVSALTTFIGEAGPNRPTSDPVWRIRKVTIVGTETTESFADGDIGFTKVWDDRLNFTYA